MFLLDFLFYYITLYFIKRPQALSWSTPEQRAIYALSLITTCWLLGLEFFIVINFLQPINSNYLFINVFFTFGLMSLYKYIYVTNGRLEFLRSTGYSFLNLNENLCIVIAWMVMLLSAFFPCAVLISHMPPNK